MVALPIFKVLAKAQQLACGSGRLLKAICALLGKALLSLAGPPALLALPAPSAGAVLMHADEASIDSEIAGTTAGALLMMGAGPVRAETMLFDNAATKNITPSLAGEMDPPRLRRPPDVSHFQQGDGNSSARSSSWRCAL